MSLSDTDRETLVKLEYEKAQRFLNQADNNYKVEEWEVAANRYYYACFHAVQALFIRNSIASHRHAGLLRLFGQNFIQTGMIDRSFGPFLNKMEQLRTKADYDVFFLVGKEDIDAMVEPSHLLVERVGQILWGK